MQENKTVEKVEEKDQKIDKEVFETFFRENYVPVEYKNIKEEFEEIASAGNDIFTESYEARNLTKENFILYLTNDAYCAFEAVVEEALDDLNPEIVDAVMDVTTTMANGDEITEKYWNTGEELLKEFLYQLYDEVISTWR